MDVDKLSNKTKNILVNQIQTNQPAPSYTAALVNFVHHIEESKIYIENMCGTDMT